jgi:polyisoprenyl-phosphate glycosyltransferase
MIASEPDHAHDSSHSEAADCVLSIVVPVYNEELVLEAFHSRLLQTLLPLGEPFEVIFVDDGSADSSPAMIDSIVRSDPRFKALHFSRNFGHQPAVTAGLRAAQGQCTVVMDADLQDPPAVIPEMLERWREGFSIVYAERAKRRGTPLIMRSAYSIFYRALARISDVEVPLDTGDFCLMDKQVVDLLNMLPERNRYVRGLRAWLGFSQTAIPYERPGRYAGETKYPFRRLVGLAVDGVLSLSKAPLRLSMYFGFFASSVSFLLGVFYIGERLAGTTHAARGYASTIVVVLFLGGVQLICLGVIGEYIGRIYDEVKQRPLYIVSRSTGF